jgi:hypothetical protein
MRTITGCVPGPKRFRALFSGTFRLGLTLDERRNRRGKVCPKHRRQEKLADLPIFLIWPGNSFRHSGSGRKWGGRRLRREPKAADGEQIQRS